MNNHTYTRHLDTQVWLKYCCLFAGKSTHMSLENAAKTSSRSVYIAAVHCLHIVTAVLYWILTHLSNLSSLQVGLFILNNPMMNSIMYCYPLLIMLEVCQNARTVWTPKYSFDLMYIIFPSLNVPLSAVCKLSILKIIPCLFQCLASEDDLCQEYGILQLHVLQAVAQMLRRGRNIATCCHPIPNMVTGRFHSETLVTLKI